MELGAFSISLNVKDLAVSRTFYEKLGFEVVGGTVEHNYLILRNGTTTIGLFEGMFEKNTLTFNPGWDAKCNALSEFTDVREIETQLKDGGIAIDAGVAVEPSAGPGYLMLTDPDDNPIMIDQHV